MLSLPRQREVSHLGFLYKTIHKLTHAILISTVFSPSSCCSYHTSHHLTLLHPFSHTSAYKIMRSDCYWLVESFRCGHYITCISFFSLLQIQVASFTLYFVMFILAFCYIHASLMCSFSRILLLKKGLTVYIEHN